jgi:hypothetical protein
VTQNRACNANQKAKKEKFESHETIDSLEPELLELERGRPPWPEALKASTASAITLTALERW